MSSSTGVCCAAPQVVDVAVNITASPSSDLLGSSFNYTINMTNVGSAASSSPNGFVVTLPPGVTLSGTLASVGGTPPAVCTTTGSVVLGQTLNCSVSAALDPQESWSFIVAANTTTLGTKTATVALTKPDSNPSNNWDDAVVSPFVTCGQPFGLLAPRPSCPAGRVYVGPDNAVLPSSTDFGNLCCVDQGPLPRGFDVAVTITATPTSGLLGYTVGYTIDIVNVGFTPSPSSNDFVVTLPPGVEATGPLVAVGAPLPVNCTYTGNAVLGTTITCTVVQDINPGDAWSFVVPANVTTLGTKNATVSLTKPDSNPNNNWDDAVVSPFVTCGQPFGLLAPRPSCPAGRVYVGPDNAVLSSSTDFGNLCCIDQGPLPRAFDVGVTITANPTSGLLGYTVGYTIDIVNVGFTPSPSPNDFVVTLPPGVEATGPLVAVGAPLPVNCTYTGNAVLGTTITCNVVQDINPGDAWSFVMPANVTTLGTKTATVTLTKPDSNLNNNWDDAVVSPFVTCGQPFGLLAPRPSCGTGNVYVGPDGAVLTNSSTFQTTCCVSGKGASTCS